MPRIFLDLMGGDSAPQCTVSGAFEALRANPGLRLVLAGVESQVRPLLTGCDDIADRFEFLDTPEVITNHEAPVMAVRQKKQSGIVRGMLMLREGEADGFVSAGSTGAVLAGGMFRLGRIQGVERPALAPLLPNGKGFFCLIDCGANVDCLPQYLAQFGVMGAAYMRQVRKIAEPRVGLVNIGAEEEKGNSLTKAAYPLMEKAPFHFVGNVEGRDITADVADVVVCDGFSGNVLVKTTEGTALELLKKLKKDIYSRGIYKLGALLMKRMFAEEKEFMNYQNYGGSVLLGTSKTVVKGHGSSKAVAVEKCIEQAYQMEVNTLSAKMEEVIMRYEHYEY